MDVVFFCLYCDAWSCRCSCMGSVSVSSCRCCMFVSPKGSGSYLRSKTHIQHTHPQHLSTITQTSTNHKTLTATGWGKQKETLMATYKVMRPALEYTSSVWSPITSSTSINKLQVMQNAALRTATGCTQDTNIQHLYDETLTLPIHEHLQLHASQYKQKYNIHHIPYTNTHHTSTLQD